MEISSRNCCPGEVTEFQLLLDRWDEIADTAYYTVLASRQREGH
jgi:hypothetical protein